MRTRRSSSRHKTAGPQRHDAAALAERRAAPIQQVIDGLPLFVAVLTPEGLLDDINRAALDLAALQPDDALGRPFEDAYWWSHSEDVRDRVREAVEQARRGETARFETDVRVGPEAFRAFEFTLTPLLDSEGGVMGLAASGLDVTERRRTGREPAADEDRLRGTLENAAVGIAHLDRDGHWLRANPRLARILGYKPQDLLQTTFQELTHPDDRAEERELFAALVRGEAESQTLEKRCIHRQGHETWVQVTLSLQRDAQGQPQYVVALVEDITPRKRADEEFDRLLERQQRRTRQLHRLATMSLAINSAPTPEAVVRVATDSAREILGAHAAATHFEPHGQWAEPLDAVSLSPRAASAFVQNQSDSYAGGVAGAGLSEANEAPVERSRASHSSAGGSGASQSLQPRPPDALGRVNFGLPWLVRQGNRTVRMTQAELEGHPDRPRRAAPAALPVRGWLAAPLLARDGRNLGLIELTDRIEGDFTRDDEAILVQIAQFASVALEHARGVAELREVGRAKSELLANVSHEIRSTTSAILGMAQLALDEDLSPTLRDHIQTLNSSAEGLLRLLNDVLDFSRMEAGVFKLTSDVFHLRDMAEETVKALSVGAYAKGLELNCDLAADVPDALLGDAGRLRQILTNLIGNAIKFTEQGEVVLRVQADAETADGATLRFTVSDTGIGLAPEGRERIFAAFAQADEETPRRYGGTGLGLAICSQLLSQMGGRLWVESELGRGSDFHFTVLFPKAADDDAGSLLPAETVRGVPALIVDDNATSRAVLERTLCEAGLRAETAASADAALARMTERAGQGSPFAVVLVDALMPGTDGFALLEQARRRPPLGETVVLMLSAADRHTFAERLEQFGPVPTLEKPVTRRDLARAVLGTLHQPSSTANGPRRPEKSPMPRAARTLQILLAEDTPANRKVVTAILEKNGQKVTVAHNGREVVELYKQRPFDLVLMDVKMPTMDGFQATALIRTLERETGRRTPIIALTASALPGDYERCLQADMDDYLPKPIDAYQLLDKVHEVAERLWAEEGSADMRSHHRNGHGHAEGRPAANLDAALARMGGNRQLLTDMAGFFLEDAPTLLQQIREQAHRGETAEMQRAAHSLKGLAANFDAHAAVEAAYHIEREDAVALRSAPELIDRLQNEVDRLQQALSAYRAAPRA